MHHHLRRPLCPHAPNVDPPLSFQDTLFQDSPVVTLQDSPVMTLQMTWVLCQVLTVVSVLRSLRRSGESRRVHLPRQGAGRGGIPPSTSPPRFGAVASAPQKMIVSKYRQKLTVSKSSIDSTCRTACISKYAPPTSPTLHTCAESFS